MKAVVAFGDSDAAIGIGLQSGEQIARQKWHVAAKKEDIFRAQLLAVIERVGEGGQRAAIGFRVHQNRHIVGQGKLCVGAKGHGDIGRPHARLAQGMIDEALAAQQAFGLVAAHSAAVSARRDDDGNVRWQ